MDHERFLTGSVVMVDWRGCLVVVVEVVLLLFDSLQNNISNGMYNLCSFLGSSYRFQSSLAWLAFSLFFLRLALTRQLPQQYRAVQSVVMNGVPHSTQGLVIFM